MRVEPEGERWLAYVEEKGLTAVDRLGGEQRARAIFDAACAALDLDAALLGPIEWGEHPKPTACSGELWPGTRETTTNALCVAFDFEHRPLWIDIHWSAAVAARRDKIKASRDVLTALRARAPADVIWTEQARLSLEGGRPVYRLSSSTGISIDTTTVDAVTGIVLDVHTVDLQ